MDKVDGNPIIESDIKYQDDLVCILYPEVKKGILVRTNYNQPEGIDSLCKIGLKTGKQLHEEGVEFGRKIYNPYIFFRAPYFSREIDYSTLDTEIFSSYGENQIDSESTIYIRIDPERTYVFSSEIRTRIPTVFFHIDDNHLIMPDELSSIHSKNLIFPTDERYNKLYSPYLNKELEKSKKTLSKYLSIIKDNETKKYTFFDLYTSEKVPMQYNYEYPIDITPIERNSEILVSIPHLTSDYFVLC